MNNTINMIYSISYKDNIIGNKDTNDLVFSLREDLQFFKEMTLGTTMVMGRNTFISLPTGGLPKRKHVIVSNTIKTDEDAKKALGEKYIENLTFITRENLVEFLEKEKKTTKVSIIGGGMLYSSFIKEKELSDTITSIYATEMERIPNISNPIKLEAHDVLRENFKSEVFKVGEGKDRLDGGNIVKFKVVRYFK